MELPVFLSLFLILLLLYWSSWISSAETALFSLPTHTLKTYHSSRDLKKQLIAKLLSHPRDLLVTVFMINTFVNIMIQNVASDMFGSEASWTLKVAFPLIITLIFCEIIPKYIGMQNNISISYRVINTIEFLQQSLTKLRKWIVAITTPISRIIFFFLKKEGNLSLEEIRHVLKKSEELGMLQKEECELLSGYLHMQSHLVKELMIPRLDILYYNIHDPLSKLIFLFSEGTRTRLPVCNGSLDHILGIIDSTKFFYSKQNIHTVDDLKKILEPPFYIPENAHAKIALKQMDEESQMLALVVDEYGSLVGLIARQDLIEVVIGKITDPRNLQMLYMPAGKNEVIASGKWDLEECNLYFKVKLKSAHDMFTIGGWLIEQIGEIPKTGAKYNFSGLNFSILSATPTRINRLFIKKT